MTEAYLSNEDLMEYYGDNVGNHTDHTGDASHMPVNFGLVSLGEKTNNIRETITAVKLKDTIMNYLNARPSPDYWPNFHIGNHDKDRAADRFGEDLVDAMNIIYLMLPGSPITYYGEELGMSNNPALVNNRDERAKARSPMQWTSEEPSGGFSTVAGWLEANRNFASGVNVADQEAAAASHLKVCLLSLLYHLKPII